jgi:zinc transport system substrate-binding protein
MRSVALMVFVMLSAACGNAPQPDEDSVPEVATSIPPHEWLVRQIGGDAVRVRSVLGPGDSPATHQPSDASVSAVMACEVFYRTGVPFENGSWFDAIAERVKVVDLRTGVSMLTIGGHTHNGHAHHGGADPHIWVSPSRLAIQARTIADSLSRLVPDRAGEIDTNLRSLVDDIDVLDEWIRARLAPYAGRAFLVFHPSWGTFADDYGLVQIAVESDGKEPSDVELTELADSSASLGIGVVFVQPQIAGRGAEAVADAIGGRTETLDPLAPDILANLRLVTEKLAGSFDD